MTMALTEKQRKYAREWYARKRAAMTPEERATVRKRWDENYRNAHREERRAYDRMRYYYQRTARVMTSLHYTE